MKTLRAGVSRLREELAALLGADVAEVAGPAAATAPETATGDGAPIVIGTEAVLHRLRRAAAVAFLDIDLHLLAPRLSATHDTLALLVRAGRLVGPRGGAPTARVLVQTRVPEHPVLEAAARGGPAPVLQQELELRRAAALPPFSALAVVAGPRAPEYAAALAEGAGACHDGGPVTVSTLGDGRWLVGAPAHAPLCDLLARTPRPPGRGLRVEVDPVSV
jgi:primosomal protein N' (replication factor Y)